MRKRNMEKVADTILWYTLYLLPVLAYLFLCRSANGFGFIDSRDFYSYMESSGLISYGPVNIAFLDLFTSGDSAFILSEGIIAYLTWFVNVSIVHLFVDFLLFVPRMAHKWFESFGGS